MALTETQKKLVAAAREKAFTIYEGGKVSHRSCGITLAETFNLATAPYQALRKGGITGCGECGAIVAGRLVLGEYFGDPDPTGPVTAQLREAIAVYERLWRDRIDRRDARGNDVVCNTLTGQFEVFKSPERHSFCTDLASAVAEVCAEAILAAGGTFDVTPIPDLKKDS